jgi:uncharacterized hydrophobic protein (TIGR00271 family)
MNFNLFSEIEITNDITNIDRREVVDNVNYHTNFSLSYILLLVGSSVVTTLGLLLNNAPTVIGGMIISPLMWPLLKISLGVSYERNNYIQQALTVLMISILVSLFGSILITFISPIRLINAEILARTNPTLIDLIIALVAGGVAALALIQPKISENLAGVAIATSLMPPLCVSGIGIALQSVRLSFGGFTLFLANILAIIFVNVVIFTIVGFQSRKKDTGFKKRAIGVLVGAIVVTSIPLFFFLQNYTFRNVALNEVSRVLEENLEEISPTISLGAVRTDIVQKNGEDVVSIDAEIFLPQEVTIDFEQNRRIVSELEDHLDRPVDLSLILSRTLSVVTEDDRVQEEQRSLIQRRLLQELESFDKSYSLEALEINRVMSEEVEQTVEWRVDVTLSGSADAILTFQDRDNLENSLNEEVQGRVSLDIMILPQVQLRSSPELASQQQNQEIRQVLESTIAKINNNIEISAVKITTSEENENLLNVEAELKVEEGVEVTNNQLENIKFALDVTFAPREFNLTVALIEKKVLQFTSDEGDSDIVEVVDLPIEE